LCVGLVRFDLRVAGHVRVSPASFWQAGGSGSACEIWKRLKAMEIEIAKGL
jgi:hypothetical protein